MEIAVRCCSHLHVICSEFNHGMAQTGSIAAKRGVQLYRRTVWVYRSPADTASPPGNLDCLTAECVGRLELSRLSGEAGAVVL